MVLNSPCQWKKEPKRGYSSGFFNQCSSFTTVMCCGTKLKPGEKLILSHTPQKTYCYFISPAFILLVSILPFHHIYFPFGETVLSTLNLSFQLPEINT